MIDILAVGHAPILRVNRSFYRALARRGWNIEIAMPNRQLVPGGPALEPAEADDPPIHMLEARGSNSRFWTFDGLSALVERLRPRFIYLENEPDSRMAWALGGVAHALGSKLLCITNENDLPSPFAAIVAGEWKPALRSIRSRAWSFAARGRVDHVFAICDDGVIAMNALGFKGRVTKVPLGFDAELFRPLDGAARDAVRGGWGLTAPTIAYFGRLVHKKGVHLLIEALARLRDLEWQFLLDDVNEDDRYAAGLLDALKRYGIAERTVQFHAGHSEMPGIMNAADIVVAPSIWKEQYGRVVPEAMACGRAVVVSDIGAMPELLGDCGLKVPAGEVAALVDAIGRLLRDGAEAARLGEKAAARARAFLSLDAQAELVEHVLRG